MCALMLPVAWAAYLTPLCALSGLKLRPPRTSSTGPLPLATLGSVHPPPRVNALDVTLLEVPVSDSTRTGSETSHQQPPRSASKMGPHAVYRAWAAGSGRME